MLNISLKFQLVLLNKSSPLSQTLVLLIFGFILIAAGLSHASLINSLIIQSHLLTKLTDKLSISLTDQVELKELLARMLLLLEILKLPWASERLRQ